MAALLAFFLELGVFGLWLGLSTGTMTSVCVQTVIQSVRGLSTDPLSLLFALCCSDQNMLTVHAVVQRTDWDEQSRIAQERARKRSMAKAAKAALCEE